jgi:predicted PurR-regulated permease PerM
LIALIIGERLMGIPGLILAPVVLNYVRVDMLKVEVGPAPEPTSVTAGADRG